MSVECRAVPSELEEPVLVLLAEPPDGQRPRSKPIDAAAPPLDDEDVEVLVNDDVPPSPPNALSRVIASCLFWFNQS